MRDLPESIDSKYRFITLAAKRCEMLQKGARPKIDISNFTKYSTVAMEEVLEDLVAFRIEGQEDEETSEKSKEENPSSGANESEK